MNIENMHYIIGDILIKHGWTLVAGPAFATKTYDTAVGRKEAIAWLPWKFIKDEEHVYFRGQYESKGDNILVGCTEYIPVNASAEIVANHANAYCDNVDEAVRESYAGWLNQNVTTGNRATC